MTSQKPYKMPPPPTGLLGKFADWFESLEPYAGLRLVVLSGVVALLFSYYQYSSDLIGWYVKPSLVLNMGGLLPALVWQGEVWRLLTFFFLHSSLPVACVHFVAQILLASRLETSLPRWWIVMIWFGSGLMGGLAALSFNMGIFVGGELPTFGLLAVFLMLKPPQNPVNTNAKVDFRIWCGLAIVSSLWMLLGRSSPIAWTTPHPPVILTAGGLTGVLPGISWIAMAGAFCFALLLGIAARIRFHPLSVIHSSFAWLFEISAGGLLLLALMTGLAGWTNPWRGAFDFQHNPTPQQWQLVFDGSQTRYWQLRWLADQALEREWWDEAEQSLRAATEIAPDEIALMNPFDISGYYWSWCHGNPDDSYLDIVRRREYLPQMSPWVDLLRVLAIQNASPSKQQQIVHQIEEIIHGLRLSSEHPAQAWNMMAYFYAQHGIKLDHALELMLRAVQTESDIAYLDTLAWVYYMRGEYQQARETIEMISPAERNSHSEILFHYGVIVLASEVHAEYACEILERALMAGTGWFTQRVIQQLLSENCSRLPVEPFSQNP